jgi:hypothetical protein
LRSTSQAERAPTASHGWCGVTRCRRGGFPLPPQSYPRRTWHVAADSGAARSDLGDRMGMRDVRNQSQRCMREVNRGSLPGSLPGSEVHRAGLREHALGVTTGQIGLNGPEAGLSPAACQCIRRDEVGCARCGRGKRAGVATGRGAVDSCFRLSAGPILCCLHSSAISAISGRRDARRSVSREGEVSPSGANVRAP